MFRQPPPALGRRLPKMADVSRQRVTAHLATKTHICSDLVETQPNCSQRLSGLKKQFSKMVGRPPGLGRPPKIGRKIENAWNCLIQRENWSKVYVRFFQSNHYNGWLTGKITSGVNTLPHICSDLVETRPKCSQHLSGLKKQVSQHASSTTTCPRTAAAENGRRK